MAGGGGGSAGEVDFPDYMETFHSSMLDNGAADFFSFSVVDAVNTAYGSSPYSSLSAYDPDSDITEMTDSADDLQTLVTLLSSGTGLDSIVADIISDSRIDASVAAFQTELNLRLTSDILPRFQAGMRDINAVVSSAFPIGQSNIESMNSAQLSRYSADLKMKAFSDDALHLIALKLEYQKFATHYILEANRLKIVSKNEQNDTDAEYDVYDASWDLEIFQYASNALASISGAPSIVNKKRDKARSALAGGVSGAASGAMVGAQIGSGYAGYGAIIGAVVGAAAGYIST